MRERNCEHEINGRERDILFSMNSVFLALDDSIKSEALEDIISSELALHGFINVILHYDRDGTVQVVTYSLPSSIEEMIISRGKHVPSCDLCTFPQFQKNMPGKVEIVEFSALLSHIFFPSGSHPSSPSLPSHAALFSLPEHELAIICAHSNISPNQLPSLIMVGTLLETVLSNRKQSLKRKEQNEFYQRILQNIQEGVLIENPQARITFTNPQLLQMLGYTEDELIGEHYSKIVSPEFLSIAERESKKRPLGLQGRYELCLLCKDGSRVPVIVSATPLFKDSSYVGAFIVLADITAQKKAETEVRALKEFNENIIQSMHEAIIIEDAKGIITFINPRFEELIGFEQGDILGHHWSEFTASEFISKVEEESARRIHGISGQYEAAFLTKNGRKIPVMVGSTPLFEDGIFKGTISVCVNLTVVKEKEGEINRKNEDLQLLSHINHALNTGEDLHTILTMAVKEGLSMFEVDCIAILLQSPDNCIHVEAYSLSPELHHLFMSEIEEHIEILIPIKKGSFIDALYREKKSYIVQKEDIKPIYREVPFRIAQKAEEFLSLETALFIPLVVENHVLGIMAIGSQRQVNTDEVGRLKSLSKHLGVAIHHAQLDETLQKTSKDLKNSLSEQILLRELLEKLYGAQSCQEVVKIAGEGLRDLNYKHFAIGIGGLNDDHVTILDMEGRESVAAAVANCIEKTTGDSLSLDKILLFGEGGIYGAGEIPRAIITDNIVFEIGRKVEKTSLLTFIRAWTGGSVKLAAAIADLIDVRSVMCIPFQGGKEYRGIFVAGSHDVLSYHDLVVLETLAQIVSEVLEKLEYSDALENKTRDLEFTNKQLNVLQEINNALNSTMDLGEILKILVKGISSVFGYNVPSIYLLSEDKKYLQVKEYDMSSKLLNGIIKLVGFHIEDYRIPLFEGSLLKRTLDSGKPFFTNDIARMLKDYTEDTSLKRLAGALSKLGNVNYYTAIPLMAGNEPVGMLAFGSKKKIELEDIHALSSFLNQAALAIAKARLYEELTEANRMKSEFIDVASHELRTPLTSIKLYLEMIKMSRYGKLSPELEEKVGLLQSSAERLQEIIDQTLVSSRILKEKLELKKEEISLPEFINDVVTQLRPLWESKNQIVDVQGPYKLPPIEGDPEALWKVITALLDNAIKYSPRDSKITIKLYDLPEDIQVSIIDEGIGIQQEYLSKIFDEFFIIPSETEYARMDGRTGLGLFIARGIVQGHGGKMWVESVYGLGSTFHFSLPK
ncbi:MAG: PAS domain S-box protein [Theionarchaea archaeon]|nr:PAS domain S-box protein [Theionarchaea archaeon]